MDTESEEQHRQRYVPCHATCRTNALEAGEESLQRRSTRTTATAANWPESICVSWDIPPNEVGRLTTLGKDTDSCADVEELTERVLYEARVFITPGFVFGSNEKEFVYIRISLCCKDDKLAKR